MALLASKSQYGSQSHSYGPGPHVPTPQYAKLGNMNSNAENPELLDDIKSWDERKVCEWLRSINCSGYSNLFQANNITGETLLECDQAVLKEIGITKVGDRVRIFVAVKSLRDRAFGNARKRNRDTLASLDQLMNNSSYRTTNQLPATSYKVNNGGSTPRKTEYSSSGALNSGTYRTNSPGEDYGRAYKGGLASPQYGTSRGDTVAIRTKTPHGQAIGAASRHNASPSLDGIMGLGNVWQNCVKMIGADGSTKIFDVSKCNTAEQILTRALKKFGIYDDWSYYCVYTVEESTGVAVCLSDSELVRVCSDSTRLDRGRLILRRKGSPPSATEIKVAQEIARENAITMNMSNKAGKINKLLGESADFGASSSSRKDSTPPSTSSGRSKHHPKLTAFFGQRPPSELIGANLSEYFPGHERELEATVRNSIRRSIRMSRYQNRLSVATTRSYASSLSDAPPVPTVGEAWLSATAATPTVSRFNRPLSVRKSVLSPTAYDANDYTGLGTLQEEDTLVGGQRAADNRKSYMSFRSGHKVVVTDTEDSGGDSYFDDRSVASTPMTPMDVQGRAILEQFGDEDDEDDEDWELMEDNWNDLKWIKGQMIGAGSFGSVYLALNSMTGVLMAVKQVELAGSGAQAEARKKSMLDALEREIDLLKDLQHPNIVQYLASSKEGDHLNIFLEYVPGGSVSAMLNTYGPQAEPLVRNFVRQILTGLAYLHDKDIIHRDIKGANILVDNKGGIKISDFGISKKIDTGLLNAAHRPSLQGSVFWMAPEVVKQTSYTKKADIWSLGCLIVEMLTGTHPYPDCTQLQAIFKIGSASAAPTLPTKITAEAKQFLNQTFEQDYTKRPSAHELLQSPFLAPLVGGGNNQSD